MSVVRSLQRLLGRSRLIALGALVAVVFFTAGFAELAVAKRLMEARYQHALEQVDRTKRQNTLLQVQLERAQRGELLAWQAWDMFGKLPKGAGGIQTAPGPTRTAGVAQPELPIWRTWLKSLGIN